MIVLITGVIGHGKTQHALRLMLDYIDENKKRVEKGEEPRKIFTDISGINTEGVTPLDVEVIDSDFDWRDTPPSSVIFYDECQKKDWIKDKSGALTDDPRVTAMETSRHEQRDIILICQGANYIHTHIQGLVSPHYHCLRPMGAKFTNVYVWSTYQKYPASPTARKASDDQKIVWLGKKLGQYYKSANEHNEKFVIPWQVKVAVTAAIIAIVIAVNKFFDAREQREQRLNQSEPLPAQQQPQTNPQQTHETLQDALHQVTKAPDKQALRKQYLPEHIYKMAYDEHIRPATVISVRNGSNIACRAYNSTGERLMIEDEVCLLMSNRPAFIPRSRQKQQTKSLKTSMSTVPSLKQETHVRDENS